MRKRLRFLAVALTAICFSFTPVFAQTTTISGRVVNASTNEGIGSVTVTVKGETQGTYSDPNGEFKLSVKKLPVVLVFSSIGYEQQEVTVNGSEPVTVSLRPGSSLGQEVVVAATRTPQRILESPVSIERIGASNIRTAATPDYYELVKNLKGVDLTISSITFKTVSTRGFNGSGNLRFNQLVDGIDNQAPGLNFSVGSIVGPSELDIENVELLQGASSALYGSGGTNGTMLVTSKDPFKYQGLSFQVKQGMNRVAATKAPAPYYDWALRFAKKIGEKFAFKISGQFIHALDWEANDSTNLLRNNVFSSIKSGDRRTDPNYDGVNIFGDEASATMAYVAQAGIFGPANTSLPAVVAGLSTALGRAPTPSEIINFYSTQNPAVYGPLPYFATGLKNNYYGGQAVSRTGYNEKDLVDYHAYNVRVSGSLNYKISDHVEASLLGYWGTGTTVYTGADRYAIKNLKMGQYKAELKSRNWFLRATTTQENSGDAYTATTSALYINRAWSPDATWFGNYTATYAANRALGASDYLAHQNARTSSDANRYLPGSANFNNAFNAAVGTSINKGGAKFDDASDLYHFEGQYNLSDQIKVVDVLVGASYRIYHLNSHGTIFADTTGPININEVGGYVQLQKSLFNDVLKLTGSFRYDKNQNFEGRVTPRATALIKVAPNNNIRLSYQTAYRFPSTQDQYINLLTGGVNRLIGGLPEFNTYFQFNTNPAYTSESIVAYRNSIAAGATNPALLKTASFQVIKPERANSYELGYRGLLTPKLLADGYVYYSQYQDFIGRTAVGRGNSGNPANAPVDLASPFTTNNYSFVVNTTNDVHAIGWGVSINYRLTKGFELNANVSSDQLDNVPAGVVTFFNTPKYRYNVGIANNDLGKGIGFNAQWRWQDKVFWEGTFGTGEIPAFGTLDLQVSYKLPSIKSLIKIGGSNFLNDYYRSAFGNPRVGGLYYISFAYHVL